MAVAVGATLVAAGKIALTRKANPLADVASGLLIVAATSAVGVLLPTMLLKAGDAWSAWVLAKSAGDAWPLCQAGQRAVPAVLGRVRGSRARSCRAGRRPRHEPVTARADTAITESN